MDIRVSVLVTTYSPVNSVSAILLSTMTSVTPSSSETLNHCTCGRGRPDTLQESSTRVDTSTVWLAGGAVMSGEAAQREVRSCTATHLGEVAISPCASNMKDLVSVAVPSVMVLEAVQLYSPESESCRSHRFNTDTVK